MCECRCEPIISCTSSIRAVWYSRESRGSAGMTDDNIRSPATNGPYQRRIFVWTSIRLAYALLAAAPVSIKRPIRACARPARISRARVAQEPRTRRNREDPQADRCESRRGGAAPVTRAARRMPAKRMNIPRVHRTPNAPRRTRPDRALRSSIEPGCPQNANVIPKTA